MWGSGGAHADVGVQEWVQVGVAVGCRSAQAGQQGEQGQEAEQAQQKQQSRPLQQCQRPLPGPSPAPGDEGAR